MIRDFLALSVLFICIPLTYTACNHEVKHPDYLHANRPLKELVGDTGGDPDSLYIRIDKSDFVLTMMLGDSALKEYPVVLGSNPVDDKRREGDGCTPEGTFKVRDLYPHARWSKFIWVDYPTDSSWIKHRQAKADGSISQSATIGGEIGIHGVPNNNNSLIDHRKNWTAGCISLRNPDVDEIYPFIRVGTPIIIQP